MYQEKLGSIGYSSNITYTCEVMIYLADMLPVKAEWQQLLIGALLTITICHGLQPAKGFKIPVDQFLIKSYQNSLSFVFVILKF